MGTDKHLEGLLQFLQQSPTPFHAVANLQAQLCANGFEILEETERWQLQPGKSYVVNRNGSSLVAFRLGKQPTAETGVRLAGTHTDSPALRVKPRPVIQKQGYVQLGVEVYGSALLAPWFDRDLSLAGRVNYRDGEGRLGSGLIDFKRAIASIPSLAIHLDRGVNESRSINAEKQLPAILLQEASDESFDFDSLLLNALKQQAEHAGAEKVLSHELLLYDVQAPAQIGLHGEFIASARLDNLLSSYIAVQALIESGAEHSSVVVCNDHEEVGSVSAAGAQGTFLKSVLARCLGENNNGAEDLERCMRRSLMLSVDNTHGVHPNFADKHDDRHGPLLNAGPAIKVNANQRYASNGDSVALFRALCEILGVPVQQFVSRADMACGSTIGPLTAAETGMPAVDLGVATFAMHSVRELGGSKDPAYLQQVIAGFFNRLV